MASFLANQVAMISFIMFLIVKSNHRLRKEISYVILEVSMSVSLGLSPTHVN